MDSSKVMKQIRWNNKYTKVKSKWKKNSKLLTFYEYFERYLFFVSIIKMKTGRKSSNEAQPIWGSCWQHGSISASFYEQRLRQKIYFWWTVFSVHKLCVLVKVGSSFVGETETVPDNINHSVSVHFIPLVN